MGFIVLECKRRDGFRTCCFTEDNNKYLVQWNRDIVEPMVNRQCGNQWFSRSENQKKQTSFFSQMEEHLSEAQI